MTDERQISYHIWDLEDVIPTPSLNLPDLKVTKCGEPGDGSPYMVFFCEPSGMYSDDCPVCHSKCIIRNGMTTSPRIVHDINIGHKRVDLIVTVPRYKCRICGNVFQHRFESILPNRQMTQRLYEQLGREVFVRSFTDVAYEFGYSESSVRNIFDNFAAEMEENRGPVVAPRVLGIDEKHIVHAMRGVFVDVEKGRLLEMTENNREADIVGTIESMVDYDKNIKIVTTDMANNYRSYIQYCLPWAKIIVDKFHVYQALSSRVSKTKSIIMERIAEQIDNESDPAKAAHLRSVRDLLIHNAYLFKFSKRKLSESKRRLDSMANVCETFPELNHLRLIKQGFERIYDEAHDRQEAETLYNEWTELVPPATSRKAAVWEEKYGVEASVYEELRSFYKTTQNWHTEIFNYFDPGCQFTNAASEGTNNLIQRINTQGSGYGFARLRAKALYASNVGNQRITYRIKTSQKETISYSVGYSIPSKMRKWPDYETRIETVTEIVMDQSADTVVPSVLSFVDGDDFYNFGE